MSTIYEVIEDHIRDGWILNGVIPAGDGERDIQNMSPFSYDNATTDFMGYDA